MKLEDIKDQADLDMAIKEAINGEVEGLVKKNSELLGKLAKAKESVPDDLDTLRSAAEELERLKEGQLEEQGEYKKLLDKTREQHAAELEKLQGQLQSANAEVKNLLVHDGLVKELGKHNVNPVLIDAAVTILAPDVALIEDNGKKSARVGEETLDIFVEKWSNTDIGKNFILASSNSGGGAGGNGDSLNGVNEHEVHFKSETWNLTEQAKLARDDPKAYDTLHAKYPSRKAVG